MPIEWKGPIKGQNGALYEAKLTSKMRAEVQYWARRGRWYWRLLDNKGKGVTGNCATKDEAFIEVGRAWVSKKEDIRVSGIIRHMTLLAAQYLAKQETNLEGLTPQAVANIFGRPIAKNIYGEWHVFQFKPHKWLDDKGQADGVWESSTGWWLHLNVKLKYKGEWHESLTLPSGGGY